MKDDQRNRMNELLDRIPQGTVCTETNHCGGCLSEAEENELNDLLKLAEIFRAEQFFKGELAEYEKKETDRGV